jgi:hypothetical protein
MTRFVFAAALLALSACQGERQPDAAASAAADSDTVVAAPTPPDPNRPSAGPDTPLPIAPGAAVAREKAARGVLLDWGRALELRQFGRAFAQFAPAAAPVSMDGAAYERAFAPWRKITVAMPVGVLEAEDAGYFYRAPTTIKLEDGARRKTLSGTVVLYNEGDGQPWKITAANGLVP